MKNKTLKLVLLALLSLSLLAAAPAGAQTTVTLDYTWTVPATGSPVDHYVIEHSVNGGSFVQVGASSTNTYSLQASVGDSHRIRVAGVDDQDRQGPFSLASDPHTPDVGPPGQPGKPILL